MMEDSLTTQGAGISPEFYATLGLDLKTRQGVAYKRVQELIQKYCPKAKSVVDYGSGAGRSSRLLKQMGIEKVVGVDINPEMVEQARKDETQGVSYHLIENGVIPLEDGAVDLVFSGIVLLEISKAENVSKAVEEMKRVVKKEGIFMILHCTKEGYITNSDSFQCLLTTQQKAQLKDGDPVPTRIIETGQEFTDYFWSDEFMRNTLQEAGLKIKEVNFPPATLEQNKKLTDKPTYVVYVCQKK